MRLMNLHHIIAGLSLPAILATTLSAQQPGGRSAAPGWERRPEEGREVPLPVGAKAFHDLAYVTNGHPRQRLDLYLPDQPGKPPLIIIIHGGAFRSGDKGQTTGLQFLRAGYAVASLNYRLSGDAIFPAAVQDCKAAVRWLRANAAKYHLDPDHFGAWGSSAGGNLVAMLGTTGNTKEFEVGENLSTSSRVQAVADFFGPTDFLQMDSHRLPNGMVHDDAQSPESLYIGGPIQEKKDQVAKSNPITFITGDTPPFFIAHGDMDPLVPHHQSVLLEVALKKAGVPVQFHTVKGAGHGFHDAVIDEKLMNFFEHHLKPAGTGARWPGGNAKRPLKPGENELTRMSKLFRNVPIRTQVIMSPFTGLVV